MARSEAEFLARISGYCVLQCIIMKAEAILLFFVNYITISLSTDKEEINKKDLGFENLKYQNKNCSKLLKIIEGSKTEAYTTNCKTLAEKDFKINEETILRKTCQVVDYVIDLICASQYFQRANKYLSLNFNNTSMCPFNFSLLPPSDNSLKKTIELLSNETVCNKTCYDLFGPKSECVILHNSFEYLKIIKEYKEKESETFAENHNRQIPLKIQTVNSMDTENKEKLLSTLVGSVEDKQKIDRSFKNTGRKSEVEINKENFRRPSNSFFTSNNIDFSKPQVPLISKPIEEKNEINSKILHQNPELSKYTESLFPDIRQSSDTKKMNHIKERKQIILQSPAPISNLLNENQLYSRERILQTEESHFIFYFLMLSIFVIVGYLAFHNKNKILAYALEGKNNRRHRRRSNSIKYKKLESNLEEVIVSDLPHVTSASIVY